MKICVITWPIGDSKAGHLFIKNFLKIIKHFSDSIILMTAMTNTEKLSKNYDVINVVTNSEKNLISKILNNILFQIKIGLSIIEKRKQIDIIWFYGGAFLTIPILVSYILKKEVYINVLGPESTRLWKVYSGTTGQILSFITKIVEYISYNLAYKIVIESEGIIKFANLEKFSKKITIVGGRFIDTNKFTINKKDDGTDIIIGFVGRISEEKGIINFIEAIKILHNAKKSYNFLIGGDGPLFEEIKETCASYNNRIDFTGWIEHEDLPNILNRLNLLILPSYTEGVPTIILESMACGTPVLATDVGGINDIIKDGVTGFILKSNDPKSIAEGIEIVQNSELKSVAANARRFIEMNYSFENAIYRYKKVLLEQ
ncbi:MAG: glycosyltransferase family 4 protein [Methanobacterium sp.]